MNPHLTPDGWLRVPYDGREIAVIEIQLPGTGWLPAYLDWDGRNRVAQVRWRQPDLPAAGRIRVNGTVTGSWGKQETLEEPARAAAPAEPPHRIAGSSRDTSVT